MFMWWMFMAVKTLTITKDVYDDLVNLKGKDESFSELFRRLANKEKTSLMDFAGIWANMNYKDVKGIKKGMKEFRKSVDKSFNRRLRELKIA